MTARAPARREDTGRGDPGHPARGRTGPGRTGPGFVARRYRQLRGAHPVDVLRWQRAGVLACILATAAVCLGVTLQASNAIATVKSTQRAETEITRATRAEASANAALHDVFGLQDPTLTGLGAGYYTDITEVIGDLSDGARDNGPGAIETPQIEYAENLLTNYLEQSQGVVADYALDPTANHSRLGSAGEKYATDAENQLTEELGQLQGTEMSAKRAQQGTWSLNPGPSGFWWALACPVFVLLLLIVATARMLARHFRRLVSGWLLGALVVTAATAAALGYLNARDAASTAADPWASHPATLTIAMLLFAVAAALAYRGYEPRLREYLFRPAGRPGEGAP